MGTADEPESNHEAGAGTGFGFYRVEPARLPHKQLPLSVFLLVEEAIRVSWQRLKARTQPRIDLRTAEEDDVTHDLYEIIFDEVFGKGLVDGFDTERFTVVTRESKLRNYDGQHLDKMPDMLVGIAGRTDEDFHHRSQDWLFIECKPVNGERTVGAHYGKRGIARFIRGDYAWTMTSALMVAYTSPGYSLDPKLIETLAKKPDAESNEFQVLESPKECRRPCSAPRAWITKHGRTFRYRETGVPAPPIVLRHLWLQRS